MSEFRARLASVRATPSRADDVKTVTRVLLEAHDIEVDPLVEYLGDDVRVVITSSPLPRLPLEQAIDNADLTIDKADLDHGTNGTAEVSAGRRRRGIRSAETAEA
jgi:hypothetical protein